jgi:flagellar basal body rod protein FlgC
VSASADNPDFDNRGINAVSSLSAIGLSGMKAAQLSVGASAHNIANLSTPGFRRDQVSRTSTVLGGVNVAMGSAAMPGPALETDMVGQLAAANQFLASLAVFRTQHEVLGSLLDIEG